MGTYFTIQQCLIICHSPFLQLSLPTIPASVSAASALEAPSPRHRTGTATFILLIDGGAPWAASVQNAVAFQVHTVITSTGFDPGHLGW
jgi:hypothetical protein